MYPGLSGNTAVGLGRDSPPIADRFSAPGEAHATFAESGRESCPGALIGQETAKNGHGAADDDEVRELSSVNCMLNNVMGCVVALIPEGMPIAVLITLMMIAKRMKPTDNLLKGLSIVEIRGRVNVICSDKKGTLTQNLVSAASAAFADGATSAHEVQSSLCVKGLAGEDTPTKAIERLHEAATLCNDASFDLTTLNLPVAEWRVKRNATDAAVLRLAALVNGDQVDWLLKERKRAFSIPFNSRNKWMLTMFRKDSATTTACTDQTYEVFVKGAPDVLLPACTKYWPGKSDSVDGRPETRNLRSRRGHRAVYNVFSYMRHTDIWPKFQTSSQWMEQACRGFDHNWGSRQDELQRPTRPVTTPPQPEPGLRDFYVYWVERMLSDIEAGTSAWYEATVPAYTVSTTTAECRSPTCSITRGRIRPRCSGSHAAVLGTGRRGSGPMVDRARIRRRRAILESEYAVNRRMLSDQ